MIEKKLSLLLNKKEFSFLKQLYKQFPKAEIFLVGGIIRDIIITRQSKDYDFVVRNVSINRLQAWLKKQGWVDLVGKNFGVLKFLPKGIKNLEPLDIALPRTEHAFDTGGYRDFDVQSDPKLPIGEDLKRRDFTINALAYDVKNKKLIDLFNGLDDIKNKRIKTVGQPNERFKEDYSRMLRSIRFSCQLDFAIEKQTWSAIKKLMPQINKKTNGEFTVPRETIAKEMAKAYLANPARAFELYDKSGAIKELMPELLKMKGCPQPKNFHSEGDVWKHTFICLQNLNTKKFQNKFGKEQPSAELVFGLLFHDMAKPLTIERRDRLRFNNHDAIGAGKGKEIMKRLKISNAGVDIDKSMWLARKHMIVTHTKKSPMKKTTLEKYFFNDIELGQDLLRLMYADIMATVPPNGRPNFSDFKSLENQINELTKNTKTKKDLPKEILNGNEIMNALKIKPGPRIGELKNLLREEQLKGKITTKKQATKILKQHAGI
ncbi:hypothetical protein KKF61_03395 [Patescibacteria group bacterium]|nr:hypothetical protein [Patescibacteria group bacterium]MBU0964664.1 hypothetical protein [Patescibacteria group bacterium]